MNLINLPKTSSLRSRNGSSAESPLSAQQQRFWLLDQLFPGNPAYNIAVRWQLSGRLNAEILERAVNEIVRRHQILRTRFELRVDCPVQIIERCLTISIPGVDLRHLKSSERNIEEERLTLEMAGRSFDLTRLPLIRAKLLRMSDEEHVLLVIMHHIVSDGWSIGIFVNELAALYMAFAEGSAPALLDIPLQYADYAITQRLSAQSDSDRRQLAYWARKLANLPTVVVPADRPRPLVQTSNGTIVSIVLPRELTNILGSYSAKQGVTLFMTAYAALVVLLHLWTRESDIVVGTQVAGRNALETEDLIGIFINVLVLRTTVRTEESFDSFLARARTTVLEALANQEVSFERLVEELKPKRDLSINPLFSVNFIYQRAFVKNQTFAGISLVDLPSRSPGSLYDLNFFMVERVDGWRASCEYNRDLYDASTVERMLAQYQLVLEAVAFDPNRKIAELIGFERPEADTPKAPIVRAANLALAAGSVELQPANRRSIVGPRNQAESQLAMLWKETLGVDQLGVTEDVFDLGASSLKAASLVSRISRAFGVRLSLMTIFLNPTIEKQAIALQTADEIGAHRVVALQPLGSHNPFFFLEAEPRFLNLQRHFAPYFAPEQPIVSPMASEQLASARPYDLRANAEYHTETILSVQPNGPYRLGGYSAGGVTAYEVAQQLWRRGHQVDLLVLFDTPNPYFMGEYSALERFRSRQRARWAELRALNPNQFFEFLSRKVRAKAAQVDVNFRRALSRFNLISGMRPDDPPEDLFWARRASTRYYKPEPYPGRMLLFRRTQFLSGRYLDPAFGWGDLVKGGLEICSIQCDHQDLFDTENVGRIAEMLRGRLYGESLNPDQPVFIQPVSSASG